MKRLIFCILVMCAVVANSKAQNKSINFEETKEWKKIIKKAKKEKKLIFVDCYTSWCGPCKMLAKNVFTNDEVANFFNEHFVNAKYDMEKGIDGPMLKKQFDVKVYPTLLFIDPFSGEIMHCVTGAGTPKWLIGVAKLAMEPDKNLNKMLKRYAAGEREKEFLRDYMSVLYAAHVRDESARVACEYLEVLPADSLYAPGNWYLIERYVDDPLCPLLKRVMVDRGKFYATIGQTKVDSKLSTSIYLAAKNVAKWQVNMKVPFDEKRNQELIDYLLHIDFVGAPAGLSILYTAACVREKDYCGLLDRVDEALSYNLFRDIEEVAYFRDNIKRLVGCEDEILLKEGIRRIERFGDKLTNPSDKYGILTIKAVLQKKIGDIIGAENSTRDAEKYLIK